MPKVLKKTTNVTPHKNTWVCPKCGREFKRKGQTHSCRVIPINQHFENKDWAKDLYQKLINEVRKQSDTFRITSLDCCIQLRNAVTFMSIKILKNKIRLFFSIPRVIKSNRIMKSNRLSAHRYGYSIDLINETDINKELLGWINEACHFETLK